MHARVSTPTECTLLGVHNAAQPALSFIGCMRCQMSPLATLPDQQRLSVLPASAAQQAEPGGVAPDAVQRALLHKRQPVLVLCTHSTSACLTHSLLGPQPCSHQSPKKTSMLIADPTSPLADLA
jgi:hypothetical protein